MDSTTLVTPAGILNRATRAATALVFMSGFCALVYQVVWMRQFRLVFGASTSASAAVVAIFIAGLGTGGLVLGRRVERSRQPLLFYAQLETGIAVFSALTPWLLAAARNVYIASGGTLALGMVGASAVRLVLATLVLGIPTFLMGGTLPAVACAVATREDRTRRAIALVYGVNTFGAVLGCLLSNFALLEIFGAKLTLWIACLINLLVVVGARSASRTLGSAAAQTTKTAATERGEFAHDVIEPASGPAWLTFGSAAVVGFAFFLMELVWYRLLGPLLGGTIFTFGLILAVALAGIGIGSSLYTVWLGGTRARLSGFALSCLLEAACIALPYALGDRIALWALLLRPLGSLGFAGFVFGWAGIAAVVVLPVAIVSGLQFPMLIASLGRASDRVGRDVGAIYAANTAGAIVGAIAGGFGLLPAIGALACWRLVAWMLCAWGALALVLSIRAEGLRLRLGWAAAALVSTLFLLRAEGPSAAWRHAPIGAGRVSSKSIESPNGAREFLSNYRRAIGWQADGIESAVALDRSNGLAFIVNGKSDGNARVDAATQVMAGLLGAVLQQNARSAMVIGLGTGSTGGWLAKLPSMQRVDVAEIEPAIVEVAARCAAVNENALHNPKLHVLQGDAREVLGVSRARYDVIFSEPSNPYRAGIASMYTREFYQAVTERLAPDGIFIQWMQAYEIDAETIQAIFATLSSVFPSIETWNGVPHDLLLVVSRKPIVHDLPALRARLREPTYARAMSAAWRSEGAEGLFSHYVARSSFARVAAEHLTGVLNSDDLAPIEFGFGRMVGDSSADTATSLMESARMRGENRPMLAGGTLDFARTDFERESFMLTQGSSSGALASDSPYLARFEVLRAWHAEQFDTATAALRAIDPAARTQPTAIERLAWSELLAHAGDAGAPALIAALAAEQPTEAAALHAVWLLQTGQRDAAFTAFANALHMYESDPWPLPETMKRVLGVLENLGLRDSRLTEKVVALLSRPFAVHVNDHVRERGLLRLLLALGPTHRGCVEALGKVEPNPYWTRAFLDFRAACYAAHKSPLLERARDDLQAFLDASPRSFDELISDRPAMLR
jgi:spermidine synthase